MNGMDDSNKQYFKLKEVLTQCSHQAKRIKKLTRSANAFAHQAEVQGEKVQSITKEAALLVSSDLAKCPNEKHVESTMEIQAKLEELLSHSEDEEKIPLESQCSSSRLKEEREHHKTDPRLPELPSAYTSCMYDDTSSDDISDAGSDFFPDWSCADSAGSSCKSGTSKSRLDKTDREDVFLSDEDLLKLSDDDFDYFNEDNDGKQFRINHEHSSITGECSNMAVSQPIPAAGNDLPGTSFQQSNSNESCLPTSPTAMDSTVMKPHALRRVKSMVLENDLEDGVEIGRRMYFMQQKNKNASMTSQPSPLLSTNDITSLKKTPSQTSTKYSLKRSRSNISAELSSCKRKEEERTAEPIVEESDEDAFSN